MVFGSKRKSKTVDGGESESDGPPQPLRASELIGDNSSALSLDGRSLIVPDYGDEEDMSSLGTSKYGGYRGDGGGTIGYIGDMRIIGKTEDYESQKVERENDPALQYGDYDLQTYDYSLKSGIEGKEVTNESFDEKKDDEDDPKKSCCPLWIVEAPLWLKLVIISSTALLVGAVVLIVVGAKLSAENQFSPSLQDENPASTLNPTPTIDVTLPTDVPLDSEAESMKVNTTISPEQPDDAATSNPTENPPKVTKPTDTSPVEIAPTPTNSSSNSIVTTSTLAPVVVTEVPTYVPSNATTITAIPTVVPTVSSTLSTVNFLVMGGRFDGEEDVSALTDGLQSLPVMDDNTVLFHLGDWNSPYATSCEEDSFITNVGIYNQSSVPVYFVPGDNEYNDCPNPTQALEFWYEYLLGFETKYWPEPSWDIVRQSPDYSENFVFLERNVLFVGINLVGGIIHNQEEWDARHLVDLVWIDTAAAKYNGNYTTMVILAHADPDIEINQNFFTGFYPMVKTYDEKVIFIHRNLGVDTWNMESGFNGIPNLDVVAVEGSTWPPMWVQIDPISGTYTIDQSSWYDEYVTTGSLTDTP